MASLALSIGLISFLNRREELTVPNWPRESINTGMALFCAVVTPRLWPIKQLSFTLAPTVPIQITLLAVVTFRPAPWPKPILPLPVLLFESAVEPMAVFALPVVLLKSASKPLAVLAPPVLL